MRLSPVEIAVGVLVVGIVALVSLLDFDLVSVTFKESYSDREPVTEPKLTLDKALLAYSRDDYDIAMALYRPLAEQGNAEAQFRIGDMYEAGKGLPKNYHTALEWYRKAALQGHDGAQNSLGIMYSRGIGTSRNMAKALEWYEISAKHGNVAAQLNLCQTYSDGYDVTRDKIAALMWQKIVSAEVGSDISGVCEISTEGMAQSEIAEAETLAEAWHKEHRSPRPK